MNGVPYVDHLLRNREQVAREMNSEASVRSNTLACFLVFLALSAFYGLVMGSQNLIRTRPDGWKFALAAAGKLPVLFLLTLAVCMPLFYVLNVLVGPRLRFAVVFGLLMASVAVTSVVLAACAPILAFFMLSTPNYAFVKLLNVAIFIVAGAYGVSFLGRSLAEIVPAPQEDGKAAGRGRTTIVNWWLATYGIVGTQMAWILRPFVGEPNTPFSLFRALESNFYVDVLLTIGRAMGAD